jgi:hypothetical protein
MHSPTTAGVAHFALETDCYVAVVVVAIYLKDLTLIELGNESATDREELFQPIVQALEQYQVCRSIA